MPDIGSAPNKTFQRTDGTRTGTQVWQEAKGAGVKIRADAHDTHDEDLGDSISNRLMRDGGNQPSADIPWNSKRITGLGAATARTDATRLDAVQDDSTRWGGTAGGTGDALTATLVPAITSYATGMLIALKASATNTGAATLNSNSVGAGSIKKGKAGATALVAGDITSGGIYYFRYDGTNWQLLNPGTINVVSAFIATLLDDADAATARATLGLTIGTNVLGVANNLSDVANAATSFTNIKQAASTSATGVVQKATAVEVAAQTADKYPDAALLRSHPGVAKAWVVFDGTTANNLSGTYSRTGTTVTVTITNHGLKVGHRAGCDFTTGLASDGTFNVATVPDANTFTFTHTASGSTSGNITLTRQLILGSYGVDSVMFEGTGIFAVNFTTAFADANYSVLGTALDATVSSNAVVTFASNALPGTMSMDLTIKVPAGSNVNSPRCSMTYFGN